MIKILVAEVDQSTNVHIWKYFKQQGWRTTFTTQSQEVGRKISDIRPDFIVLGSLSPPREEFTVFRALKEDPNTKDIPVVMISWYGDEKDLFESAKSEHDAFLVQPFNLKKLVETIQALRALPKEKVA